MKKINKNLVFLSLLGFLGFGFGCTKRQEFTGKVEEVRITNLIKSEVSGSNKSGDALLGALIGGAITGGVGGAAIGAAVGADGTQPQSQFVIEPLACKFFVKISNGIRLEFAFPVGPRHDQDLCTLLRVGETVSIEKTTDSINSTVWYTWLTNRGRIGNGIITKATE